MARKTPKAGGALIYQEFQFEHEYQIPEYAKIYETTEHGKQVQYKTFFVGPNDELRVSINVFPKGRKNRNKTEVSFYATGRHEYPADMPFYFSNIKTAIQNSTGERIPQNNFAGKLETFETFVAFDTVDPALKDLISDGNLTIHVSGSVLVPYNTLR